MRTWSALISPWISRGHVHPHPGHELNTRLKATNNKVVAGNLIALSLVLSIFCFYIVAFNSFPLLCPLPICSESIRSSLRSVYIEHTFAAILLRHMPIAHC